MSSIQFEKELFVQKGQIREKNINKDIAVSWRKSKLYGLRPETELSDAEEAEYENSELSEYCERIIPDYLNFFITNGNGTILYERIVDDELKKIRDLNERSIGTTSFSVAITIKKDAVVKKEEHYLNQFTEFTSRTILIPEENIQVTLFYRGHENEYLYMSIRNSLISYVDDGALNLQNERQEVSLSNYINLDEYSIEELDNKLIVTEGRFPLLIYGRDAEYLAWYLSDKMLMPTLRISHKGIPENLFEDKLIDYSKKTSTLIIAELDDAPERYLTLISQIVDYMIEESGKRKKQIILTSKVKPTYERIIAKLGINAIDLDSCMFEKPQEEFNFITIEKMEEEIIEKTLHATGWNPTLAAKKLGIGRATLYRKMKLYQFEKKRKVSK